MVLIRSLQIKRLFLQPSQKEEVTRNGCNASRGFQCWWRNVTSIWSKLGCKVQKMVDNMLPHQIPPGHWLVVGLIKTLGTKLPDRVEAQKGIKDKWVRSAQSVLGSMGAMNITWVHRVGTWAGATLVPSDSGSTPAPGCPSALPLGGNTGQFWWWRSIGPQWGWGIKHAWCFAYLLAYRRYSYSHPDPLLTTTQSNYLIFSHWA